MRDGASATESGSGVSALIDHVRETYYHGWVVLVVALNAFGWGLLLGVLFR